MAAVTHDQGAAVSGLEDARTAVMAAAAACAAAASVLYGIAGRLRGPAFDETVIEAERARAADEALAAHGLASPPRGRLHSVG